MARTFLPLGLKKIMDAAAPVHRSLELIRRKVSELGGPVAAEAGAYDGDFIRVHFGPLAQIFERHGMHSVGVRSGEHRTLAGTRAVHDETTPTFFDEGLAEGVALFFPVIDAAPVHDHGGGKLFREAQMTDDGLSLKWDRHALDRNIEVFRSGEKHLAGLLIAMVFTGRARERVAGDAVVTVGF